MDGVRSKKDPAPIVLGEIEPSGTSESSTTREPSSHPIIDAIKKTASAGFGGVPIGSSSPLLVDHEQLAPMRVWERFIADPALANVSRGYRALAGAQKFALKEILATFNTPGNDDPIRHQAARAIDRLRPGPELSAFGDLDITARQQRALTQVLGWCTDFGVDRDLRLEAIEKLGWIADAELDIVLRQKIDAHSQAEREAASRAHRRLIERGVVPKEPDPKTRAQQKQALLEVIDTFQDPVNDAALREHCRAALDRLSDVTEWPGREQRRAERTVTERQQIAIHYLLLTLDDPWRDGDLIRLLSEKLGWVGDHFSARVLARASRFVTWRERDTMIEASKRLEQRGKLERSRFVPELFGEKSSDAQVEWIFRNARIVERAPLGEEKGANDSELILCSAFSLSEAAEYWALGIFKPSTSFRDGGWQYGAAAYEVSKDLFRGKLNPVPPTFETIVDGVPGSVQMLVIGETAKKILQRSGDLAALSRDGLVARELSDAMVFDRLIENSDRFQSWGNASTQNVGNYIFAGDRTLLLIDHDLTFGRGLHAPLLPERYNRDTVENLRRMQAEWNDLSERLGVYLHAAQSARVRSAIDEILQDVADRKRTGRPVYFDSMP
jgi:hypothetical protein